MPQPYLPHNPRPHRRRRTPPAPSPSSPFSAAAAAPPAPPPSSPRAASPPPPPPPSPSLPPERAACPPPSFHAWPPPAPFPSSPSSAAAAPPAPPPPSSSSPRAASPPPSPGTSASALLLLRPPPVFLPSAPPARLPPSTRGRRLLLPPPPLPTPPSRLAIQVSTSSTGGARPSFSHRLPSMGMFYVAARGGDARVFRMLLDHAMSPRCSTNCWDGEGANGSGGGRTSVFRLEMMSRAVHATTRSGSMEMLRELVQGCSDVSAYLDVRGSTVLHVATGRGQLEGKEREVWLKNLRNNSSSITTDTTCALGSELAGTIALQIHEMKKKEKEYIKLQERLNQVLMEKTKKSSCSGMEIMNLLQKEGRQRSTWNGKQNDNDYYKMIVDAYKVQKQELVQDSADLRSLLRSMQFRQAKTGIINVSRVAYRFMAGLGQNNHQSQIGVS